MNNCIFCKIRDREIPKEFTYEDEEIMVFPDIAPRRPVHLLIVPKKHVRDLVDVTDYKIMEKVTKTIQDMIKKFELDTKGYRLVVNGGGAQIVDHVHVHIMGPATADE